MKSTIVIVLILLFSTPSDTAHACGEGADENAGMSSIFAFIVLVDTGIIVYDLAVPPKKQNPYYAFLKTLIVSPQFVISSGATFEEFTRKNTNAGRVIQYTTFAVLTGWLTYNGVSSLVHAIFPQKKNTKKQKLKLKAASINATLSPILVNDGQQIGTGLGIIGHF